MQRNKTVDTQVKTTALLQQEMMVARVAWWSGGVKRWTRVRKAADHPLGVIPGGLKLVSVSGLPSQVHLYQEVQSCHALQSNQTSESDWWWSAGACVAWYVEWSHRPLDDQSVQVGVLAGTG